jgi:4-hydroxybenzoate polyprenyltransferase
MATRLFGDPRPSGADDGGRRRIRPRAALAAMRRAVRWREWYATKLPFVWTASASAAAASTLSDRDVLQRTAAVILFTCLCGAFGHVANDHADRASDRAAGRHSPVSRLSPGKAWLLLTALAAAALAALAATGSGAAGLFAGAATLALAAAYSLAPIRLKGRSAAGLWSAAAAQRTLPVLLAFAALGHAGAEALAFAAVAQLAGLRWMLVHQIGDAENDRRAGIATYVVRAGDDRARRLVLDVLLLELAAIGVALWAASTGSHAAWTIAAGGAIASCLWVALPHGTTSAYALHGFERQPLAAFYQIVWPLGAALLLAWARPGLWPLAAAFLLWEARYIGFQLATALRLLRTPVAV